MLTCYDIANYFLTLVDDSSGERLTNLKLQKLVYYAQGFHLALYDEPLFTEEIEAWTHGPVIPVLYQKYEKFGINTIPLPIDMDPPEYMYVSFSQYSTEVKELLNKIHDVYGQYSAWKLRDLTRKEAPWRDAYDKGDNSEISLESMRVFFLGFNQSKTKKKIDTFL